MCGIAGIIFPQSFTASEDAASSTKHRLQSMATSLQHRGPDGEGFWISPSGTTGFAHRRLSIIDLSSAGEQPMHYMNRYTIIHNGEIYNYIELREELKQIGYSFQSQTDTEVITAAYDYWEDECVDHFDGMFAFAIWDEKEKELFAARDRFGEKPFFYHFDNDKLIFVSEIKALWAAGIEKTPNLKMLFNFITIGYTDNPERPEETFYENIYKLPPATVLKYNTNNKELELEKYWEIDPEIQDKKITETEAIEKFTDLFVTAVKRRLRSDVTIGTSLSGGLDSSSIAALVAGFSNTTFNVFTGTFPSFKKDELQFSKQVAEKYNLTQYTKEITGNELLNDWDKLCYHQEEPFGSSSIYAQYKVYELAAEHGVKVLLDGQGADETLAGYHKYYKWYWQELFRNRRLYRSKELKSARELGITEHFDYKNMIAAYFPAFANVTLENQYLLKAIRHEDLRKDFVQLQSKEAYYTTPEHFTLNGVLHFNTVTHGLEELLRYADRNAMAHGREVRLPFLSHELVEFVFTLPSHFKIKNGWTKWLLRETMKEKLPDSIAWRKDKVGFEPPQKTWMQNKNLQEAVQAAKQKLVGLNILKSSVLDKPVIPRSSHDADNYDWRYFAAAPFL